MILRQFFDRVTPVNIPTASSQSPLQFLQGNDLDYSTLSGQAVTPENSNNLSTAYRCVNIICNDFAKLPEQVFVAPGPGRIERMHASGLMQNAAYLLEKSPNRWMTPFKFKRVRMRWLLLYGASYVWMPPRRYGQRTELFVLPSDRTYPWLDDDGNLWYNTTFRDGSNIDLPSVEVLSLLINSADGLTGAGIISYARETLGRRMGASVTQSKFYSHGLNPGGILWMNGELSPEARRKVRDTYAESMSGAQNAYSLAVMDNKVLKFEQITMKPVDVQFLQGIEANELEIANFFDMPLYKLNMGKQSYNSNEQQALEYLSSCLDPYLVQAEEVDAQGLLTEQEQETAYVKFNRDALLRTDLKTRAEAHQIRIQAGLETPNEGRTIEDLSSFEGGDGHYFPSNMATIARDGSLNAAGAQSNGQAGGGK